MIAYSIDQLVKIVEGNPYSKGKWPEAFKGVSTNSKSVQPEQLFIPLVGEKFDGHQFLPEAETAGVRVVLCNESYDFKPQTDMTVIYVHDTFQALHKLAAFYRKDVNPIVIAVTGSNGKTTTKDMLAAVCETSFKVHKTSGNLNNQFGLPYTLLSMPSTTKVCIVEMGMNHFGEISLLTNTASPDIAIITNIGDAHIEFFGTRENIAKAKLEIIEGLKEKGTLIHYGDEPLLSGTSQMFKGTIVTYGEGSTNAYRLGSVSFLGETGMSFTVEGKDQAFNIPLLGRYNTVNALAAVAVGDQLAIDDSKIAQGLSQMRASGMRLELSKDPSGMLIINDAYNASPTSMKATLDLLEELPTDKKKWAVLGDLLELGDKEESLHREVGEYASGRAIDAVITVGERAKWIYEEVKKSDIRAHHFDSVDAVSDWLAGQKKDDVILLLKASRGIKLENLIAQLEQKRKESHNGT